MRVSECDGWEDGRRRKADTELKTKTPHVNVRNKLLVCLTYSTPYMFNTHSKRPRLSSLGNLSQVRQRHMSAFSFPFLAQTGNIITARHNLKVISITYTKSSDMSSAHLHLCRRVRLSKLESASLILSVEPLGFGLSVLDCFPLLLFLFFFQTGKLR